MRYFISLTEAGKKETHPLGEDFRGRNRSGEEISWNNYYMEKNGRPFFGVSGEFHFSRMEEGRWEDELLKMKMGGVNVVSTYVFWNHHEEEEGVFDFSGRRNLRRFVQLCGRCGLYVILRIGPFNHGEARNGGLPDWLYGKPFEVRQINDGFLECVRRLYAQIGAQAKGLFFEEDGPVIGVQLDNEYMHSSAPWEMTTGISNEWVPGGDGGEAYLLRLKDLALECGIRPVFFTCTAWGGAAAPDVMLPLWGGYAYRPWIFYTHKGEHPATEEYVYQDFHNDSAVCTNDFHPAYRPQERPYACCEMGGRMMCCYYYRFQLPYRSVDAMANIKLGSGCNFLGYYMFHGGSNPVGKGGLFFNESQVPRISYDYQAALGEFGQVRESYRRLKSLHYFTAAFADRLCGLSTVLPPGASGISPQDLETLRFAVRTDGHRGFLFVNNFQDHRKMPDRQREEVALALSGEEILFSFGIAGDENAILPFYFDLEGIDLVWATAQPVTKLINPEDGMPTYVFLAPRGMRAEFAFEEKAWVDGQPGVCRYVCQNAADGQAFTVEKEGVTVRVLVLDRALADQMYLVSGQRLLFTEGALMEDERGIRLETEKAVNLVRCYPRDALAGAWGEPLEEGGAALLGTYRFATAEKQVSLAVEQTGPCRYTVAAPKDALEGVKDVRLRLHYTGDIGNAFLDGKLVHDNFCNGAPWEIALKELAPRLGQQPLTVAITPLKEGANVNAESGMAARREEVSALAGRLERAEAAPVYELFLESGKL